MILAIDVGNTNIVVGCIDDRKTYFIERLSTNRTKTELEYAVDLKNVLDIYHIKKTEIGHVFPDSRSSLNALCLVSQNQCLFNVL